MNLKICTGCYKEKNISEFYIRPERNSVRSKCKTCTKNIRKQYYKDNTELEIKRWIKYKKSKYNIDPIFTLKEKLRNRFNRALKKSYKKGSAVKDLGCSIEYFKHYIESKFTEGMSWDNYGQWHLDHIKPLSKFNLQDKKQISLALNYKNYQPLWAKDNLSKGSKYE